MALRTVAGLTCEAVALDQRLGADRHGGQDVVLDHGAQHAALPLGQVDAARGTWLGCRGLVFGHPFTS